MARSSGQVLVETCLVFPLAMFFIYAILQITLLMTTALVVQYSAYVGARAAMVHIEDGQYADKARLASKVALGGLSPIRALVSEVEVELAYQRVTITVSYPTPWLLKVGWLPFRWIRGRCSLVPEIHY